MLLLEFTQAGFTFWL